MRLTLLPLLAVLLLVGSASGDLRLNECLSANLHGILDEDGDNEDWIELINAGDEPLNTSAYHLSDDSEDPLKWSLPSMWLGPDEILLVFASGKDRWGEELHANFKIDSAGERILLTDSAGRDSDEVDLSALPGDVSFGRKPDGEGDWFYFAMSTPGSPNRTAAFEGIASAPQFSHSGGFPAGPFNLEISAESGAEIYFSTDGSEPDSDTDLFDAPLPIGDTQVIRARAYAEDMIPSSIVTHSYFFGESSELPILSLVTDPDNLWDPETGIYVLGDDYDPEWPHYGANFWENWEKPAHLEFFEPGGWLGFGLDLGIKIHGNWSRGLPQKSLRLHPRGGYGQSRIDYPVFPDRPQQSYKRLILRNAGNDWCETQMRDALAQSLSETLDIDLQAYRPVLLFLNGEYWGIHNLRERLDRFYLADHHGVDEDALDILERNHEIVEGGSEHYLGLLDWLESHDLSDPASFAYVQTLMDTDNYATWTILEVFFGNDDWPGNNTRFWRPRSPEGRWRWMLFDLDMSLGLTKPHTYDYIGEALWENPDHPWTTFVLRELMANEDFRRDFINRYADLLNTILETETMLEGFDRLQDPLVPEMGRHMLRWDHQPVEWISNLTTVQSFLEMRPDAARLNLQERFYLADTLSVCLNVEPHGAGSIELTAFEVDSAFCGTYFEGNPIALHARARPGWVFSGWSDPSLPQVPEILWEPSGGDALVAEFEPDEAWAPLVINEINYNSSDDFDPGDWVEIHNPGGTPWDAGGLVIMDDDPSEAYTIPEGTVIEAHGFLVLCCEADDFTELFPDVSPILGDLEFSLGGGGDILRLYDNQGEIIDWVLFDDELPWPPEADGEGPTLELSDPLADNSQAQYWSASQSHGSPGAVNSNLVTAAEESSIPASPRLEAPWPNPFNPQVQLSFSLDRSRNTRISVHDVSGRLLKILVEGDLAAGAHSLFWNGRDEEGRDLASGIYFVRMASGDLLQTRKLVLLR